MDHELLYDGAIDKRHGLVPVDVTPTNMIATCGGIGSAKVVQVLDFHAGLVGVNGVMRFLVLEEPMSTDGRQQFIPPLTPITIMRQLGANIRMKESGDVLEIEDDRGTTHTEKLVRERAGHVHNQLDFFSREVGNCQTACAPSSSMTRSSQAIVVRNARMENTNSRTKNKKLAPTAECYGALETVNTSTGETARDDAARRLVARLQQLYIGNHEEKRTAREHGFDRDFWAGSPSECTTKLSIDNVRSTTVRDVSHPSWCGNCVRLTCEKHGVAVLHSPNTTSTMTRTFGQVLLKGPSG